MPLHRSLSPPLSTRHPGKDLAGKYVPVKNCFNLGFTDRSRI